jgi:hypothetical protein
MSREPRMKPRIKKLCLFNAHEYRPVHIDAIEDTVNAIIDFLDEKYEKETTDKHVFENECKRKECRARKAIMQKELPGIEEVISTTKWNDILKEEPVSERNDDDAKKCPYRIPDCPIDYPKVSERNALIDELIDDVDKKCSCSNHVWGCAREIRKDDVIDLLKSKNK